ncbi:DUF4149 domain-containing protein [Actimicrobium sp. CCI2.3]|uniref:DUF4149 domain-containing protein n=1 Tax=Actimicrobium sp. CCI2.3 TaxID=3048616 RepID=UPI002AB58A3C|nr:DUF4149 domain-containing protein [Actimicrobium sp. CCI2.3]MDY7575286.1 DUF4149 domain-containing protein [Actimicrobium sp. CCI2.3]MEB0023124.1 DUF4149 domain-containing protein [Actimicrobium sp. CCI2.3]
MMIATRLRLLVIVLWVGSLLTIGYLVAPTLFMTLADRTLAGTIAGKLFRVEAWLSVAMALLLFALTAGTVVASRARTWMFRLTAIMFGCTVTGYFGLQPMMAALREAAPGGVFSAEARMQFGMLHGVASGLYLIQSIAGIILVLKNDQSEAKT